MRFKVMRDLDGQYVLTATITDALGRGGFWFSDYRYPGARAAWQCPDECEMYAHGVRRIGLRSKIRKRQR